MAEWVAQRAALGCAIAFTAVGILRVGVFPVDAPLPDPIQIAVLNQLRSQGWQLRSNMPARGRQAISNAPAYVLSHVVSAKRPAAVQLSLTPIRARTHLDLDVESIARSISGEGFGKPELLTIMGDQFLRFREGRKDLLASSCIAGGKARIHQDDLAQVLGKPPTAWSERVKVALGLQPPRDWSCLLVAIRVPDEPTADQAIRGAWARLRPVLISGLR